MSFLGSAKALGSAGLACLAVLAATSPASAQVTPAQQSAIKSSCRSDFMSKCSGVSPGGAAALQCLQKNVAALSPNCQSAVSATLPKPAPAAAAPSAPPAPPAAAASPAAPPPPQTPAAAPAIVTAKPPAATMPAAKPAAKPATAPKPATPPPQQAAVPPSAPAADAPPPPTAAQMNAIKNTCRGDFSRNCRGVTPGGPEALACLQSNAAKLSPNCKTSLADIADSLPAAPVAAPTAAAPTAPAAQRPNAPVVMTAVIGRACMRDLIRRCRDTGVGDGQKIACLQANQADLAPLCKAALKGTAGIR